MHLLDTETKKLTKFESNTPPYAILSHIWERDEVTFQDIADLDKAEKLQGFAKIVGACNTAKRDGFKYIWIDTCCTNKESSAELSEAINSMYAWYRNARVCYAYLWDVPSDGDHENLGSPFAMIVFYGRDWVDIGNKITLQEVISAITGIDVKIVTRPFALDDVSVAVRMSWAADRKTTRVEDVAYSIMGIFGVSMPLLYG
ncbi:heterokaryon incompatibility protein-domain-containing protein [Collybia nuda]|uniref:Heterokaryon incompatibility protein-domain-containing protein n=1 Tax=Collybia nuda TaxID=64659 RepID=A0A9P6CE16_9AGAR|nr:heterokaryon incompatibility protein-domain-containing protein [Collybia nuda]